jgi:hypothetical protein
MGEAIGDLIKVGTRLISDGWKRRPLSPVELALGYASYFHWKHDGQAYTADMHHFSFPNDSARRIALLTVSVARISEPLLNSIRAFHASFDPDLELELAAERLKRDHPVWGECVTRSTILLCRSLAYADSEVAGSERLPFMNAFDRGQLRLLGINVCEPPLGREATAFLFGDY